MRRFKLICLICLICQACSTTQRSSSTEPAVSTDARAPTLRSDVTPVTRVEDAMPGVFIPPYDVCRAPLAGESVATMSPDGKVCTHVAISGCTEAGRYFPDYGSCDVVRTQRPFWEEAPANEPRADDPRLNDPNFMRELAWMTEQVEACACTCCHDSHTNDGKTGQWDIRHGPIWLDTLSDSGLALFIGAADSSALGAYSAADNHGFDRARTGVPTDDTQRMQAFLHAELERRGISDAQAAAVPPFGGPIYQNRSMPTPACAGQGVDASGRVQLGKAALRYLYVMNDGAANPGVPPDQDLPAGSLWRLDVLPNAAAVSGSVAYAETPVGSFQAFPERGTAPALTRGVRYKLYGLRDVGVPVINCSFVFGDLLGTPNAAVPVADSGTPFGPLPTDAIGAAGGAAPPAAADAANCAADATRGFGAVCSDSQQSADCTCPTANYCAVMPGQSSGYCTATNCTADPSVCPAGWSCLDLSMFSAGLPAVCLKP